jgi:hypothetical protein
VAAEIPVQRQGTETRVWYLPRCDVSRARERQIEARRVQDRNTTRQSAVPNHKLVALQIQEDPGGGATVAFTNYVYLAQEGSDIHKNAQFEGY